MKRHFFYPVVVAMMLFSSCIKDSKDDLIKPSITMTTAKSGMAWFCLNGTGKAIIDWGDGTKTDITLLWEELGSDNTRFGHDYSGSFARTITITGGNITGFDCAGIHGWDLGNQFTKLDVSNAPALMSLYCAGNQLTGLDVSNNLDLRYLDCSHNQLTSLDISRNTALKDLSCNNNQLTTLDVNKNIALMSLYCGHNQLTSLNMSGCNMLLQLLCADNYMDSVSLDALFGTLHSNTIIFTDISPDPVVKFISIANNGPNYDGSGTIGCDESIATSKGWKVNTAE